MRIKSLLALLFFLATLLIEQPIFAQKKLNAKGPYIHSPTNTEFPEKIGTYERTGIFAYDRKKENISSTYQYQTADGKTVLSVYVYPAGEGVEGRLRNNYLQALQDIATASGQVIQADQQYTKYENGGYKINGYSALIDGELKSRLTLFECGKWFFKIRLTTNLLDTAGMDMLEKEVLKTFEPTQFVKNDPLVPRSKVYVAPAAFRDSLIMHTSLLSAFKKSGWAFKNIDSLERVSGFPDLYLQLHIESLKEFVLFEKKDFRKIDPRTTNFIDQLNEINKAGFLEEFVMEEFNMIMIVPENTVLDFDEYKYWKVSHPITIDLSEKFYLLSYPEKEKSKRN